METIALLEHVFLPAGRQVFTSGLCRTLLNTLLMHFAFLQLENLESVNIILSVQDVTNTADYLIHIVTTDNLVYNTIDPTT